MTLHKRLTALALVAGLALAPIAPAVATPTPTPARVAVAALTYPYSPAEVRAHWNERHFEKMTGSQAYYAAAWLNAIVRLRIAAYLRAVAAAYASATSIPYEANWDRVAACESGGNWAANTGNGYYGGLQFLASTWRSVGGSGLPHQNSKAEQIRRAEILRQRAGLGQWPVCGRRW